MIGVIRVVNSESAATVAFSTIVAYHCQTQATVTDRYFTALLTFVSFDSEGAGGWGGRSAAPPKEKAVTHVDNALLITRAFFGERNRRTCSATRLSDVYTHDVSEAIEQAGGTEQTTSLILKTRLL